VKRCSRCGSARVAQTALRTWQCGACGWKMRTKKGGDVKEPNESNCKLNEMMAESTAVFVFTKILHLGVMLTDYLEICEPLNEFIESLEEHEVQNLAERIDLSRVLKNYDEYADLDEAYEDLACCCKEQNRWGFLCYVEAPEATRLPGRHAKSLNLGIRRCRWFYSEDLADIVTQAEIWALQQEKKGPVA
jgi:hypothetical protein